MLCTLLCILLTSPSIRIHLALMLLGRLHSHPSLSLGLSCIAPKYKREPIQRRMGVSPTILFYTVMAIKLPEYLSPPDIIWQLS